MSPPNSQPADNPNKTVGNAPKKALCDWSKSDFREHFAELSSIVGSPSLVCVKCGRAAAAKKWLCKPKPLE